MPDTKPVEKREDVQIAVKQDEPIDVGSLSEKAMRNELAKLEAQRSALKKQTPEQAKDRDPEEYGRIKGRIAELKAALGIQ